MRESIKDRAAAIRDYLDRQDDLSGGPAVTYKYSMTAAQWEAMRLLIDKGKGTPADDRRFADLSQVLRALTKQIGLGDSITGWNDFLPRDAQRLIDDSWVESTRVWFS